MQTIERETDTEIFESAIHRATELAEAAMGYIRAITHAYTVDPVVQTEAALRSVDDAVQQFHAAALEARGRLVRPTRPQERG